MNSTTVLFIMDSGQKKVFVMEKELNVGKTEASMLGIGKTTKLMEEVD